MAVFGDRDFKDEFVKGHQKIPYPYYGWCAPQKKRSTDSGTGHVKRGANTRCLSSKKGLGHIHLS